MKNMIEWRESVGGSMGPHRNLMIGKNYVGHLYEDASAEVNVRQVLEDIEIRYNSFDVLVDALKSVRRRIALSDGGEDLEEEIDKALNYAQATQTTDAERLDWLESQHTLHGAVEVKYMVDRYTVVLTRDYDPVTEPYCGETLRDAIDAAASAHPIPASLVAG